MTTHLATGQLADSYYKNAIYGSFARQGFVHVKYERNFYTNNWTNTFMNVGFGLIPVEDFPDWKIITPELGQLIGFKNFYLELGLEPAIYLDGSVTYVDLNAIIGFRFQQLNDFSEGIMAQIGYVPRIINTTNGLIDVPIYVGIGMCF